MLFTKGRYNMFNKQSAYLFIELDRYERLMERWWWTDDRSTTCKKQQTSNQAMGCDPTLYSFVTINIEEIKHHKLTHLMIFDNVTDIWICDLKCSFLDHQKTVESQSEKQNGGKCIRVV